MDKVKFDWVVCLTIRGADDKADVNNWERSFLNDMAEKTSKYGLNSFISAKQMIKLEELWKKLDEQGVPVPEKYKHVENLEDF